MLVFEDELIDARTVPAAILGSYSQELLDGPRLARKSLNAALTAFESGGAVEIFDVVKRAEPKTTAIDKTFFVDTALLGGMTGEQGEMIMKDKLLTAIPHDAASAAQMNLAGCSAAVSQISRSSLAKFVSGPVRGHVSTCAEIVQQLALKSPPTLVPGKMSNFVQSFIDRLQWFCSYSRTQKKAENTWYGAAALREANKDLGALIESEHEHASLDASHINQFRLFWWLAEPDMCHNVDFVEELLRARHGLGDNGLAKKAKTAYAAFPSEGGASSSSAGTSAAAKRDLLHMKVMSAF